MAAGAARRDALLPARGRLAPDVRAGGGAEPRRFTFDPAHPVPTIGGALLLDRRAPRRRRAGWSRPGRASSVPVLRLPRPAHAGPADQKESPDFFGSEAALPAAGRPAGRARLPDRAARRAGRGDRADDRPSVGRVLERARHRLHGQARRRAPGQRRLPRRLRHAPHRLRHPRPASGRASIARCCSSPACRYRSRSRCRPRATSSTSGTGSGVDVSSSNWPRLDVNPNTGEPIGRHTHQVVAEQTVYCDAERPSHIVLPVIPA